MIDECPHCHSAVILMNDGTCPSCGKNSRNLSGTNPDVTKVAISQRQSLPNCCLLCGQATTRRQWIDKATGSLVARAVISQIFGIIAGFVAGISGSNQDDPIRSVSVSVPVCDRCKGSKVEPEHVDLENYRMTFLVHKTFKRKLDELQT